MVFGTIKEIKEKCKGEFDAIEVYDGDHFHTDYCYYIDSYSDNDSVKDYEVMDKQSYEETIDANASLSTWPFDEEDGDRKILVILRDYNATARDRLEGFLEFYNRLVKEKYQYTEEEYREVESEYLSEIMNVGIIEIPSRITKSGNPVIFQ